MKVSASYLNLFRQRSGSTFLEGDHELMTDIMPTATATDPPHAELIQPTAAVAIGEPPVCSYNVPMMKVLSRS